MRKPAVFPLFLLLASGAGAAPPAPEDARAEFAAICASQADDRFFGDAVVDDLRRRLALPGQSLEVRIGVRALLGVELRRLDRLPEAIAIFEEALAMATDERFEALRLAIVRDLAVAHLLKAEDDNCVAYHGETSCRLPIAPDAVHRLAGDTRRAGDLLGAYLEKRPDDLGVRWLFNLARMISGDSPEAVPDAWRLPEGALASDAPFPRWTDVASRLGVDSFNLAGGALMEDFDGDGLLDLVTSTWDPCGPMKAFRNDGRGGFEDVSREWGLDAQLGGLNLVHADYDNDGRPDVVVLRGAWRGRQGEERNSLLHNEIGGKTGRFVDVTREAGVATRRPTQTAAWADYDGDGDLDLYVGNEADEHSPYPGELYRNDGTDADGRVTFTDVSAASGVANLRFAKGVAWGDYDDDGDPDLYVSNVGPNRLYRNDGPGEDGAWRFTDVAPELGVVAPVGASFATWFFDQDNDGDLDLFVADYGSPYGHVFASYFGVVSDGGQPRLYRNDGGRFTEASRQVGLARPLLPMGANYGDLDNDGFPDVYLGTGVPDLEAVMPNVMYLNDDGRRFLDVSAAGGFGHLQKGHGVAFGDLDNDGDQDLFEQMGGAYPVDAYFDALYENPGTAGHRWITLRLEGRRANRFGVGARIEVRLKDAAGATRSVHVVAGTGGSFGGSSLQQEIGLGPAEGIERLVVRWPGSGTVQTFTDVDPDRVYRVIEGEPELVPVELPRIRFGGEAGHAHHRPAGR